MDVQELANLLQEVIDTKKENDALKVENQKLLIKIGESEAKFHNVLINNETSNIEDGFTYKEKYEELLKDYNDNLKLLDSTENEVENLKVVVGELQEELDELKTNIDEEMDNFISSVDEVTILLDNAISSFKNSFQ